MPTITKTKKLIISFISLTAILTTQAVSATISVAVKSKNGMVTSANPLASEAGLLMLKKGGNAVDAAVATTLAISVVEPFSAGIGGGGFLLFHSQKTGEIKALDFRERAPIKATRNMYLDNNGKVRPGASTDSYLAVATPGTVAGMYEVHRRYGKLPWQEVIKPAIKLAKNGFIISDRISWRSIEAYKNRKQAILKNPAASKIFIRNGEYYQPGERLIQADLSKTLTTISENPQSFYSGEIAKIIADDMAKNGGLITLEDLKQYQPIWRDPVCGNFRKARVCSMPPPSSGGIHLLQILNIIGDTNLKSLGWNHPDAIHLMVEIMKIAYSDRAKYLGDSDFVKVPISELISKNYAQKRRLEINMKKVTPSAEINREIKTLKKITIHESTETSHLNVVDSERNAVSLTFTINLGFGAGIVTPGTGIVLNNEMDDFAIAPGIPNFFGLVGNEANSIAPRKTPLSSMTPTIVTENNRLRLAVGAPGGSTIITQVLQIILNVLEHKMDVGAAVSVPRIHHQWLPDELRVETWGLDALTLQDLRRRGHKIKETAPWGNANAISVTENDILEAAADPRGEGAAKGY